LEFLFQFNGIEVLCEFDGLQMLKAFDVVLLDLLGFFEFQFGHVHIGVDRWDFESVFLNGVKIA
jgi:hypothetical protein